MQLLLPVEQRSVPGAAYHGRHVVVLGASGFIGRWVALALCRHGAKVTAIVRDSKSAEVIFDNYEIAARIEQVDLGSPEAIAELTRDLRPSVLFNLAGYGVDYGEKDPGALERLNAELPPRICDQMAINTDDGWAGQRLVHVGSALEYGPIGGNLAEASAAAPDTPYGKTKLAGTQSIQKLCQETGFRAVTARLFTIYGPGEHPGRLLPTLMEGARSGQSIPLTAGLQKRDFVYVEDAVEALLRLGLALALPGEPVNVATGRMTSVREFALTAAEILDIPEDRLCFSALEPRFPEVDHQPASLQRLQSLTCWQPETTIAEGIRKTVEHLSRLR